LYFSSISVSDRFIYLSDRSTICRIYPELFWIILKPTNLFQIASHFQTPGHLFNAVPCLIQMTTHLFLQFFLFSPERPTCYSERSTYFSERYSGRGMYNQNFFLKCGTLNNSSQQQNNKTLFNFDLVHSFANGVPGKKCLEILKNFDIQRFNFI
jgi:hypothetical protein